MCGVAGILELHTNRNDTNLQQDVQRMAEALYHRGPDCNGQWVDTSTGIALAHRRLSIIDLSPAGSQPMHSSSGRFVVAFNGEIYNHKLIRTELEKAGCNHWRGHSDTEVMLEAFEKWGVEQTVKRLIGMFAIALWDRQERALFLIRDRIGEKPLYYGKVGAAFVFGSELKALKQYPGWHSEIDRDSLTLFLRHNYIPAPYTIYKGVYKLLSGTILSIQNGSMENPPVAYWSAKDMAEKGLANQFAGSDNQAVQRLDELLQNAICQQMEADVPLGAFLSGGIDSSTIVALMQAQSSRPVKTFTIGFNEKDFNEAEHAKAVAVHLGTDHTELYVNPSDALDVIPKLPTVYDEPFSDSSQIPTFLISQLTRQHVTVSLSGDAGDELFGGYNRYFMGRSIWDKIGWMPGKVRRGLSKGLEVLSPAAWDNLFRGISPVLPKRMRQRTPGDKLHKLAEVLDVSDPMEMYQRLVSHWKVPQAIVQGGTEPLTCLTDKTQWINSDNFTHQMMYMDLVSYLPDDILVKVDRAAMGVSLETRVPFLDHRVVEFAWQLPLSMKIRHGQGKWLLRQVLYKYVPKELIERPKVGFGVPIDTWLRGPLRDWVEVLLDEKQIKEGGFFDPKPIRQKWHEHLSGSRNWQYHLWDILMFQAWLSAETK